MLIQSNTTHVCVNSDSCLYMSATCFGLYLGHIQVCQYKNGTKEESKGCGSHDPQLSVAKHRPTTTTLNYTLAHNLQSDFREGTSKKNRLHETVPRQLK